MESLRRAICLFILGVMLAAGCSEGDKFVRVSVAGDVKMDGTPVQWGQAFFIGPKIGDEAVQQNIPVRDGDLAIDDDDPQLISPGMNEVMIRVYADDPQKYDPDSEEDVGDAHVVGVYRTQVDVKEGELIAIAFKSEELVPDEAN